MGHFAICACSTGLHLMQRLTLWFGRMEQTLILQRFVNGRVAPPL